MSASSSQAVFLSYASQDAEAAKRICDTLRAADVEVWFDQSELRGGDAWDQKIRGQIAGCALFVAVVSANTQARREAYFRLEWKLADERTHLMAEGTPFAIPVTIDQTPERGALVPKSFLAVQWTKLPGGETPAAFCARVKKLLEGEIVAGVADPGMSAKTLATAGSASARPATARAEGGAPPAEAKAHRRWPVPAILGLTAVAIVAALMWLRRPASVSGETLRQNAAATLQASATPAQPLRDLSAAGAAKADKSLVVLPLENLSPDPENALFTEGMHTEIISNLQLISELKVVSRGRALAFKGSTLSVGEIAQKLGVAHVITGSVRREKDRVRITLELRRARDDALLWSLPKGDRDLTDALALQSDIADQVARLLQARETKGGARALAQFMTKDPRAYDLYLKARKDSDEGDGRNWEEIASQLDAILALDPNFMSAAQSLSASRSILARIATNPAERVRQATQAKRWADAATQMVPGGAGETALSFYYAWVEREGVRSLSYAENSIRALPNYSQVHGFAAWALSNLGRLTEAAAEARRAIELDPLLPVFEANLFAHLTALRRPDESRQAMADYVAKGGANRKRGREDQYALSGEIPAALEKLPASERGMWLWRGRRFTEALELIGVELRNDKVDDVLRWTLRCAQTDICARLGQPAESAAAARDALAAAERLQSVPEVGPTEKPGWLAAALVRNGRTDEAIATAKRFVEAASPESQVALRWEREIVLAKIYAYAKRPRECIELLAKLLRLPSGITVPMLKGEPDWDNVRAEAAFKALLADPKNSAPL